LTECEKPSRALIGVIGHVDHGKTALVRALTGVETDKLAEEQARGISIALGFAHVADGAVTADLIDMPGQERFVRTMIAGATGIDAVLLVVAANEGIMPQTVEHADIAALLGVTRAVVAVTKADLVSADEAALVGELARDHLAALGIATPTVIVTSATKGAGVDDLRAALLAIARDQQPRRADGDAWLPIDRAFTVPGHGPVATGTLRGAAVVPGDALVLLPEGKPVRVRGVQVHGESVASGQPGERVAVNVRDVELGELGRGMALAASGAFLPSEWLTLTLRATASAPPLRNGMRLRALAGTTEVDARLRLLDREVLDPGEQGLAQIRLATPLALPAREHVVLRLPSPARTVAGGRVLEPLARRRRRNDPATLDRLCARRDLAPEALIEAEIARAGAAGIGSDELARATALSAETVRHRLAGLAVAVSGKGVVFPTAELESLAARLPGLLAPHPGGLTRNQLLSAVQGVRAALLDLALERLAATGAIVRRGPAFLLPRPEDDAARVRDEAELAEMLARTLRDSGLTPPNPGAIVVDAPSRKAVDRLLRDGTLVRAVDRAKHRELLFHRDAIAEARVRLAPLLQAVSAGMLVGEIAAALGVSRKFVMPLLDHLDTIRFTLREGDRRLPGPAADLPSDA